MFKKGISHKRSQLKTMAVHRALFKHINGKLSGRKTMCEATLSNKKH